MMNWLSPAGRGLTIVTVTVRVLPGSSVQPVKLHGQEAKLLPTKVVPWASARATVESMLF